MSYIMFTIIFIKMFDRHTIRFPLNAVRFQVIRAMTMKRTVFLGYDTMYCGSLPVFWRNTV